MNILHLTPDFNYSDGRSYYVYLLLKYLKKNKHNVSLLTNSGDSFERIDRYSIPYFTEASLSRRSSFLGSVNRICKIAEENKIDIIHSHHRHYELLANAVKKKLKVKTVFTALSIVDRRYYIEYRSDRIIAVSNSVRNMLINKFNVNKNKISLIPNFTDTEELNMIKSPSSGKKDGIINILSAGRFHKDKDHLTLIKAVSILSRRKMKISLTLIGEGEEKAEIEKQLRENSINSKILPPVKDLYNYINRSDICVLSSVRDPLPGFMLESGLIGKPFIGSDADGISETIKEGVNGLIFRKKNPEELAEKISVFIRDKMLSEKCSDNLNELVLSKFTEKKVMPEIEDLYKELLCN
ncbi:MAG TPA: glycosyltransferase family 4 protein [Ignavibacteria bacterium]|nr:glycosyltransferase family 4 protein [Ignavibacteria bacterium]